MSNADYLGLQIDLKRLEESLDERLARIKAEANPSLDAITVAAVTRMLASKHQEAEDEDIEDDFAGGTAGMDGSPWLMPWRSHHAELVSRLREDGHEKNAAHLARLADVNSLKKPFTAADEAEVIKSILEYLAAFKKEVGRDGTPSAPALESRNAADKPLDKAGGGKVLEDFQPAVRKAYLASLSDERFRRLHRQFLDAAERFPDLRFAAVTAPDQAQGHWWPEVPADAGCSLGLLDSQWNDVLNRAPGHRREPLVPLQTVWLQIDGRLWQGTFYNGGPLHEDPRVQSEQLQEAIALFDRLARDAVGHFDKQPSPTPLLDVPLEDKPAHRWLEAVAGMAFVPVEDANRCGFFVRDVPGNVFTASARTVEMLGGVATAPHKMQGETAVMASGATPKGRENRLTRLRETTLRRLQADFATEAAKRQEAVALIVVWRAADSPTIDLPALASLGGLPPLGESDGHPVAERWFHSCRAERDGQHHTRVVVYGSKNAVEQYERLSKAACQSLQFQADPCEWARLLFKLAWRAERHPGTTLQADKWTVRGGVRIAKSDRTLPQEHPVADFMGSALAGAELLTASVLPDLFAASVAAIDLFLCGAEAVPFAQPDADSGEYEPLWLDVAKMTPEDVLGRCDSWFTGIEFLLQSGLSHAPTFIDDTEILAVLAEKWGVDASGLVELAGHIQWSEQDLTERLDPNAPLVEQSAYDRSRIKAADIVVERLAAKARAKVSEKLNQSREAGILESLRPASSRQESAARTERSEKQGGIGARKKRQKRGRKALPKEEVKRRNDILSAWEQAHNAGTTMKAFCKEHSPPLTGKDLERFVAWKAARKRRKREE